MEHGGDGDSGHGLELGRRQTKPRRAPLARLVTEVLAPAPVLAVLVLLTAAHVEPTMSEAARCVGLAVLFVSVVPFLYVVRGVRRGGLTDHHVGARQQRTVPLLVGVASMLVGLIVLVLWGA